MPEIGPNLQHHQDQEYHQRLNGLASDLLTPLTADLRVGDRARLRPGGLSNGLLNLRSLVTVESPSLHLNSIRAEADDLSCVHIGSTRGQHRLSDLVDSRGSNVGRSSELHATLELNTEIQTTY